MARLRGQIKASDKLSMRLARCYTGVVYDVLRDLDRRECVLPSTIRSLDPRHRLAGPAFTVGGQRVHDADPHQTLLAWTRLLSAAPTGTVVVCQPNDGRLAHMGELSAETLQAKQVVGYVVDGGCRDTEFILGIGFPVFCRYSTPADVVGQWLVDQLGDPVAIGGVRIACGDYILGDRDGVIVIPSEIAEEVVSRAEQLINTESAVRKAIREGADPQDAYLRYGAF